MKFIPLSLGIGISVSAVRTRSGWLYQTDGVVGASQQREREWAGDFSGSSRSFYFSSNACPRKIFTSYFSAFLHLTRLRKWMSSNLFVVIFPKIDMCSYCFVLLLIVGIWNNILRVLSNNCGYSCFTLYQNSTSDGFLKISCNREFEVIQVNFLYSFTLVYLLLSPSFLLRYNPHIGLCYSKVHNLMIWYMYILLNNYHDNFS